MLSWTTQRYVSSGSFSVFSVGAGLEAVAVMSLGGTLAGDAWPLVPLVPFARGVLVPVGAGVDD